MKVGLGLGSNVGDRLQHLQQAIAEVRAKSKTNFHDNPPRSPIRLRDPSLRSG
jgi:7,8-dihydro-6-hydroxymethylpterin-pyrophosphokinase